MLIQTLMQICEWGGNIKGPAYFLGFGRRENKRIKEKGKYEDKAGLTTGHMDVRSGGSHIL
jgi:hypothetical protein